MTPDRILALLATRRPRPSSRQWNQRLWALHRASQHAPGELADYVDAERRAMLAERDEWQRERDRVVQAEASSMGECPLRPIDAGPGRCVPREGHRIHRGRHKGEPEVNHVDPRMGRGYGPGCHNHQTNLQVLCHECHVAETTRQIRERLPERQSAAPRRIEALPEPLWEAVG